MPTKKQLIDAMPIIGLIIILLGWLIPVSEGTTFLIGLGLGTLGSVIFPFYREWKLNNEELKFSYVYLMPIIIACAIALFTLNTAELMIILNAEMAGYPAIVVYFGAVILGYGGKAMLVGLKNNLPFLEVFREGFSVLIDEFIGEDEEDEPEPEPEIPVESPPVEEPPPVMTPDDPEIE